MNKSEPNIRTAYTQLASMSDTHQREPEWTITLDDNDKPGRWVLDHGTLAAQTITRTLLLHHKWELCEYAYVLTSKMGDGPRLAVYLDQRVAMNEALAAAEYPLMPIGG